MRDQQGLQDPTEPSAEAQMLPAHPTGFTPRTEPSVAEHDIDVWLTYYHEIEDEQQLETLRGLLNPEEAQQEKRFYFADDRKRYLVTRAMVRTLLSRYAPINPEEWVFSKNAYGRPQIANTEDGVSDLSFNISHTKGLIAFAVARGRELGVDVENVAARQVSMEIAERFFSDIEVAELSSVPEELQQERFFEYWTLKESYIKARGIGLSLPLDRFSFEFPRHDSVRMSVQPDLEDDAGRWSFWQCRLAVDYLLAICAERSDERPPGISIRKFTPPTNDVRMVPAFLRTSEA